MIKFKFNNIITWIIYKKKKRRRQNGEKVVGKKLSIGETVGNHI